MCPPVGAKSQSHVGISAERGAWQDEPEAGNAQVNEYMVCPLLSALISPLHRTLPGPQGKQLTWTRQCPRVMVHQELRRLLILLAPPSSSSWLPTSYPLSSLRPSATPSQSLLHASHASSCVPSTASKSYGQSSCFSLKDTTSGRGAVASVRTSMDSGEEGGWASAAFAVASQKRGREA